MRCICPKHGSSPHYHVCRHVREACIAGGPLPHLKLPARDLICTTCLTAEVRKLLKDLDVANIDIGSDEQGEAGIKRFWDAFETLQSEIGYRQLCADCLYEKTGLDLRRRPLSTQT